MAEQQLVDYIQKARQANQTDDQSKALLLKNGWTDAEVKDAFVIMDQPKAQPQVQAQQRPQPQYVAPTQSAQSNITQKRRGSRSVFNVLMSLVILLVILVAIGGAGYFAITSYYPKTATPEQVIQTEVEVIKELSPETITLATVKLATVLQDYDVSKITVYSFSSMGNNVAYCLPQKIDSKIFCFLNDQKLDNSYSYKPYWIGTSPDGKRIISLYLDPTTKQSFVFENGAEGVRYDGTITSPKFSDNSQNFMYVVMGKDNKSFVVLNGISYTPHEKIYSVPTLSTDGKYILYGARDGQDLFWVADPIQ